MMLTHQHRYIIVFVCLVVLLTMISCSVHEEPNTKTEDTETEYTGEWGYIDRAGNMVIEPRFDCAWQFSESLAPVNVGRKLGYIDKRGDTVIEPQFSYWHPDPFPRDRQYYDHTIYFYEGRACFRDEGKYGFIDVNGDIVIEPVFELPKYFSDGLAPFYTGEKWGFIDTDGNIAIQPSFNGVGSFVEGMATFWNEDGMGLINTDGDIVIEPRFQEVGWFSEGRVAVIEGDEFGDRVWGYIDANGEWAVGPEPFTGMHLLVPQCYFSESLAVFQGGYVDRNGNMVIETTGGYPFSEGLALVEVQNEDSSLSYGFIDKEGNWIIEPKFKYADSFSEGRAMVKVGEKYGYIDKSGELIIQPIYENALSFSEGLAPVKVP